MWSNGYSTFTNTPQRDMQPINWYSQNISNGINNPYGLRFENYPSTTTNPFIGQVFGSTSQPYTNFGYQYRGW